MNVIAKEALEKLNAVLKSGTKNDFNEALKNLQQNITNRNELLIYDYALPLYYEEMKEDHRDAKVSINLHFQHLR